MDGVLSEEFVQDSFHNYLRSTLTQAQAQRLLDADILNSAESDLMITGPALCLYFAALRSTTNPPSVPLPRPATAKSSSPIFLSFVNCPPPFTAFIRVWARTVPRIRALIPEHRHDLARIICDLEPLSSPVVAAIGGIAADLRALAIEISQRRSFQERFAADLQAALKSGTAPGSPDSKKESFVLRPVYDPTPPSTTRPILTHLRLSPPPSPQLLSPTSPPIDLIRETLYASIANVLSKHPSFRTLLSQDAPRAYFSSVSLAILHASATIVNPSGSVISVLGTPITFDMCPDDLRAFMRKLVEIGAQARAMMEEDSVVAVGYVQRGAEVPVPRMERVRAILEEGVGYLYQTWRGGESKWSSMVAFANRINALSLGMTQLRTFRERQGEVFGILAGVSS